MSEGAAARDPAFPVPDLSHPGWKDLRLMAAADVETGRIVLEEMRDIMERVRDGLSVDGGLLSRLLRRAELIEVKLDGVSGRVGSIVLDEAILAEREGRAYDQGFAAGLAARRGGPHRNPGHLRPVADGG